MWSHRLQCIWTRLPEKVTAEVLKTQASYLPSPQNSRCSRLSLVARMPPAPFLPT